MNNHLGTCGPQILEFKDQIFEKGEDSKKGLHQQEWGSSHDGGRRVEWIWSIEKSRLDWWEIAGNPLVTSYFQWQ